MATAQELLAVMEFASEKFRELQNMKEIEFQKKKAWKPPVFSEKAQEKLKSAGIASSVQLSKQE